MPSRASVLRSPYRGGENLTLNKVRSYGVLKVSDLNPGDCLSSGAHTRCGHSIIISSGFYISELRNTKFAIKNIGGKKNN